MRPSDLPEFMSIAEAHRYFIAERLGLADDDEATGPASLEEEVMAVDWIEGLSKHWNGRLDEHDSAAAPHVAPLAEIIRRIGALSGETCPPLDETEGRHDTARMDGGFDENG